jgi:hypothetical protein
MKQGLNIQKNFGHYEQIPVCNTIKKILVGKLFNWHNNNVFVILAVRRNNLYGYLEVLAGNIPVSKKYGMGRSINVYSWYCFDRRNMNFIGRDNRQAIRNCLKTNPKYIKHHLGKSIDPSKFVLYQQPPVSIYSQDSILIYDNCNYYRDYCNLFI